MNLIDAGADAGAAKDAADGSANVDGGNGGNDGGSAPTRSAFMDSFPEKHRNNDAFYGYDNVTEVYDAFVALKESAKGAEGRTYIPGADATAEERAAFNKAQGIPNTADGYKLTTPESLPEGLKLSDEMMSKFRTKGHELSLTPKALQSMNDFYGELLTNADTGRKEALKQATDKSTEALKSKWGTAYEDNMKTVNTVFDKIGGVELQAAFKSEGIAEVMLNSPAFAQLLHGLKGAVTEGSSIPGSGGGSEKKQAVGLDGQPTFGYPELKEK